MNITRVFEHTSDELKERYKFEGTLAADELLNIPALFCSETGTYAPQVAHVGRISRIRKVGSDYQLEYTLDSETPGITNERLEALATELQIEKWEFSRTHWAIKDVDLYEVLFKHQTTLRPNPKLFVLPHEQDADLIAVMMPFDSSSRSVYETLQQAASKLRFKCQRADDIWDHDVIIQDVVSLISSARVVVCDLTGKNANVFYETGIAHTLGKDVILIAQHESDIPFDLRHIRHVKYLPNAEGLAKLSEEIQARLLTLTSR